ncbi:MAG TPA: universal stress protein [Candidatus Acidoferrales bacterium]|nr:universal stress protein [Candidatus Acidoferrales bacterium]
MEHIKKILAPTDFSELSVVGVRHALELARISGATVTVYHVIDDAEMLVYGREAARGMPGQPSQVVFLLEKYQRALSDFLRANFADLLPLVETHEKVEVGAPVKNIVEEAKKQGVDLIVMSTHGRTGLTHLLAGSVTEKVIRHAPCPVLSIRPQPKEDARRQVRRAA